MPSDPFSFYANQSNRLENYLIRKDVRSQFSTITKNRFRALESQRIHQSVQNRFIARTQQINKGIGIPKLAMAEGALGIAQAVSMPLAIAGGAVAIAGKISDYSFNRTELQQDIRGLTDIFVSEVPQIASFAVFSATEKALSGTVSGGTAKGTLQKALGIKGGGIAGKGAAFAGAYITSVLMSTALKPLQETLGGYISLNRSSGLMSSIAKGADNEVYAVIKQMAAAKGISGQKGIEEFAQSLNLPKSVAAMTTRQQQQALEEIKRNKVEGGFWSALQQGKVIKWAETLQDQGAERAIGMERREQAATLYQNIYDNQRMIIDFYTRE